MKIFKEFPQQPSVYKLLQAKHFPEDTKLIKPQNLQQLADEVRDFLLYSVSTTGGHFA